ncbi:MAG: peptide-methionine (S)-S-oxide reductase, partial [SAR202 cluster bacterium]|nr:peptide-methionine (S)-S-oxide reductase [SAR202 cluster bacterium]
CTGTTDHAEAIEVYYDQTLIDYQTVLEIFFSYHDPTTLNRQGADVGTQYRSAIFFHNETQKQFAEQAIKYLNEEKVFPDPIVTEVTHASK